MNSDKISNALDRVFRRFNDMPTDQFRRLLDERGSEPFGNILEESGYFEARSISASIDFGRAADSPIRVNATILGNSSIVFKYDIGTVDQFFAEWAARLPLTTSFTFQVESHSVTSLVMAHIRDESQQETDVTLWAA